MFPSSLLNLRGTKPIAEVGTGDTTVCQTDTDAVSGHQTNKTPELVVSLTMTAMQKVALITAGSAGLGAQIARVLAPDFRLVCKHINHSPS